MPPIVIIIFLSREPKVVNPPPSPTPVARPAEIPAWQRNDVVCDEHPGEHRIPGEWYCRKCERRYFWCRRHDRRDLPGRGWCRECEADRDVCKIHKLPMVIFHGARLGCQKCIDSFPGGA